MSTTLVVRRRRRRWALQLAQLCLLLAFLTYFTARTLVEHVLFRTLVVPTTNYTTLWLHAVAVVAHAVLLLSVLVGAVRSFHASALRYELFVRTLVVITALLNLAGDGLGGLSITYATPGGTATTNQSGMGVFIAVLVGVLWWVYRSFPRDTSAPVFAHAVPVPASVPNDGTTATAKGGSQ